MVTFFISFFRERAEARYFIKRKESDQVLRSPKWSWHLRVLHGAERRPLSLRFNYTTTLSDLRDTKPAKTHTEISLATLEQTTDGCSDLPSKTRLLRSFQSDQQTRVTRESNPFRCAFGTCFRAASYQSASESTGKGARAAKPSGFRVLNQTSLLKTQLSRRWSMDSSSCAQRAHSTDCWRLWRRRRSQVQHRSCRASLSRGLNYAHVRFQIKITYSMLPNLRQNWVTRPTRTILFWNRSCMIASDVSKLKKRLPVFSLTSQQLQIMLYRFK